MKLSLDTKSLDTKIKSKARKVRKKESCKKSKFKAYHRSHPRGVANGWESVFIGKA